MKYSFRIGFTCILFAVLITGCKAGEQPADIVQLDVEDHGREISAWGEVKYNTTYQLNIDFPAVVDFIHVKEGDVIHKGDVLADLDTTEFDNNIAKLEYKKAAVEAALSGTFQDPSGLEAKIIQAKKDVADAQRNANNYQLLYQADSVSQDMVIHYMSQLSSSKTQLQVLEVELEQLNKNNASNTDQQTNELNSTLKDLQTYQNKKNKDYLEQNYLVCSLENGIVKLIPVKHGALLGAAAVTVMEIIDADSIYISAEVNEEFIKNISPESSVRIVPTMNPELELSGQIRQISAMAVEKDGDRIVTIQVVAEDPGQLLKPGYTADVYFTP